MSQFSIDLLVFTSCVVHFASGCELHINNFILHNDTSFQKGIYNKLLLTSCLCGSVPGCFDWFTITLFNLCYDVYTHQRALPLHFRGNKSFHKSRSAYTVYTTVQTNYYNNLFIISFHILVMKIDILTNMKTGE